MSVTETAISLFEEMEINLAEISFNDSSDIQNSGLCSGIILQYISKLKALVNNNQFINKEEEINFFKHLKPKFYSMLIYYQQVVIIQSRLPLGTSSDIKIYYQNELKKISDYMNNNQELVWYYRSKATTYDEIYFLRKDLDSWLLMNLEDFETDLNFTTIYDHKISRIIAFELLFEFIKSALARLDNQQGLSGNQKSYAQSVANWTGSKVSLVELLYALQSAGTFNNGNIELKQLVSHFEKLFNIDLGNYYRVFQEMRIRKISRTTFLDQLKERLVQRMDETDENPKFN